MLPSKDPQSPSSLQVAPVAVSHLVFVQPEEVFIGLEASEGRGALNNVRLLDDALSWSRDDGAAEFIDLRGSPSLIQLRAAFDSSDGLMVLTYPALSDAQEQAPVNVTFIGSCPAMANDSREFCRD